MMLRFASFSTPSWLRPCLASMLLVLPIFASCTSSEDTEPFVPARTGATQPSAEGALIAEDEACERIAAAEDDARVRLRCDDAERLDCPSHVRPAGGSGCYEYREGSIEECEDAYDSASSCSDLFPCIVTAELNEALETCELVDTGSGGAGGAGGEAGAGGDPALGGAGGTGAPAGGAGGDAGAAGAEPGSGGNAGGGV